MIKYSLQPAFTLIEMLVVITIMMLMLGSGIAAYINFNERQQLTGAAKQMQTYLRGLQKKARVGDRPDGCTRLYAYTLTVAGGSNLVLMEANCENGDFSTDQYTLSGNVTAQANVEVSFKVLQGGATSLGDIVLTRDNKSYRFQVTQGGEITEGAIVEN